MKIQTERIGRAGTLPLRSAIDFAVDPPVILCAGETAAGGYSAMVHGIVTWLLLSIPGITPS
mgnify:CR=1 FL=1